MGAVILVRSVTALRRRADLRPARAPGEAYQRAFNIVKQCRPGSTAGLRARDEHIVASNASVEGQKQARRLAQAALGAISDHGPADLFCRGESSARRTVCIVAAPEHLDHHAGAGLGVAASGA
jgi:hypothetical protein